LSGGIELPLKEVVLEFLDFEEPTGGPEKYFSNLSVFLEASEELLLTWRVAKPSQLVTEVHGGIIHVSVAVSPVVEEVLGACNNDIQCIK
jgi:hypothetical protein